MVYCNLLQHPITRRVGDEEGDEEGDEGHKGDKADKGKGKRKAEEVKGDKGKAKIIKSKGIEDLACLWYHDAYYDNLHYYAY